MYTEFKKTFLLPRGHATQPIKKPGKVNKENKCVEEDIFAQSKEDNKEEKIEIAALGTNQATKMEQI